jgi:dihydroflavonol-4-reductase
VGDSDLDFCLKQQGQGNAFDVILVTGATGFLGHNLCPYLVERGHRVRAFVRPTSDAEFLKELGVTLVCGDVSDLDSLSGAMEGCRWVIHAAGRFRFWGRQEDFYSVNLEGTKNALRAAVQAAVERFVYISTVTVVGAPRQGQVLDEYVLCEPRDDYQRSKLEAEGLVLAAYREKGLPAIVLRPGAFYGPWGRYAFNRMFFEDPMKGLPMGIHRGKRITFPVFVPDMARAIEAALIKGQAGEVYNVAGRCLSHREVHATISRLAGIRSCRINPPGVALIGLARLWTWLARFTGKEPYYSINMVPYVFCDWNVINEKAKCELGFTPTSFEEGARQTVEWYRQQGIGATNILCRLVMRLWRKA